MKKTILITGGTGYIGSHAVVAFANKGYHVVALDNFSNSSSSVLKGIKKILGYDIDFFEVDISDYNVLDSIFQKYNFDCVVHFAGLKSVSESIENIFDYHKNNIFGSIVLFDIMQKNNVKKLIFSSSATVYDSHNISPFTENMTTSTTNPYGTTKLVIEKLINDYVICKNWQAISLRYFNPIGAHPSGYIGEEPVGIPNNIFPYILDVAIGKQEKVFIFGDDYPTIDGTGVRDYIDINDLIDAHIISYQNLSNNHKIYNIGTGKGTSVKQLINLVSEITNRKIPFEVVSRRLGDLAEVYSSSDKIFREIGWKAKNSISYSIKNSWNFVLRNNRKNKSL